MDRTLVGRHCGTQLAGELAQPEADDAVDASGSVYRTCDSARGTVHGKRSSGGLVDACRRLPTDSTLAASIGLGERRDGVWSKRSVCSITVTVCVCPRRSGLLLDSTPCGGGCITHQVMARAMTPLRFRSVWAI